MIAWKRVLWASKDDGGRNLFCWNKQAKIVGSLCFHPKWSELDENPITSKWGRQRDTRKALKARNPIRVGKFVLLNLRQRRKSCGKFENSIFPGPPPQPRSEVKLNLLLIARLKGRELNRGKSTLKRNWCNHENKKRKKSFSSSTLKRLFRLLSRLSLPRFFARVIFTWMHHKFSRGPAAVVKIAFHNSPGAPRWKTNSSIRYRLTG